MRVAVSFDHTAQVGRKRGEPRQFLHHHLLLGCHALECLHDRAQRGPRLFDHRDDAVFGGPAGERSRRGLRGLRRALQPLGYGREAVGEPFDRMLSLAAGGFDVPAPDRQHLTSEPLDVGLVRLAIEGDHEIALLGLERRPQLEQAAPGRPAARRHHGREQARSAPSRHACP